MMDGPRLLLDRRQAAHQLSISVRQLDLMIAAGEISTTRIGRRVLVSRSALEAFALKASPVGQEKAANA